MTTTKVITDPCYFLTPEQWDECFASTRGMPYVPERRRKIKAASRKIQAAIRRKLEEVTGAKAWVSDTGYGDWTNCIYGPDVTQAKFLADAGLVCVCDFTDSVKQALSKINHRAYALIEATEKIKVRFTGVNDGWCRVFITDENGRKWKTL